MGVDRNLRNLTAGSSEEVTYYDMTKVVEIGENTRSIVSSFKYDDARIGESCFKIWKEEGRDDETAPSLGLEKKGGQ